MDKVDTGFVIVRDQVEESPLASPWRKRFHEICIRHQKSHKEKSFRDVQTWENLQSGLLFLWTSISATLFRLPKHHFVSACVNIM